MVKGWMKSVSSSISFRVTSKLVEENLEKNIANA